VEQQRPRPSYFEWRSKLPHDTSGEGDGLWPVNWGLPIGKSTFPQGCREGNEEADVMEHIGSTADMQTVYFNLHDHCFNALSLAYPATTVGDLSADFHVYALYWRNDGSGPYGSMQVYFDGIPQGTPYTLDSRSKLWANGIYLLNQMDACPKKVFQGGVACGSKTATNNPFYVSYTRAWKLVRGK